MPLFGFVQPDVDHTFTSLPRSCPALYLLVVPRSRAPSTPLLPVGPPPCTAFAYADPAHPSSTPCDPASTPSPTPTCAVRFFLEPTLHPCVSIAPGRGTAYAAVQLTSGHSNPVTCVVSITGLMTLAQPLHPAPAARPYPWPFLTRSSHSAPAPALCPCPCPRHCTCLARTPREVAPSCTCLGLSGRGEPQMRHQSRRPVHGASSHAGVWVGTSRNGTTNSTEVMYHNIIHIEWQAMDCTRRCACARPRCKACGRWAVQRRLDPPQSACTSAPSLSRVRPPGLRLAIPRYVGTLSIVHRHQNRTSCPRSSER